jgi:hypothetical protein
MLDPGHEDSITISGQPTFDIGAIRARLRHADGEIGGRLFLLQQKSALFADRGTNRSDSLASSHGRLTSRRR